MILIICIGNPPKDNRIAAGATKRSEGLLLLIHHPLYCISETIKLDRRGNPEGRDISEMQ